MHGGSFFTLLRLKRITVEIEKGLFMADLFTLRPAREEDTDTINAYASWEGMDNMPSMENITVAQSAAGNIVGFLRVAHGANGVAHVNPVVTVSTWRGYGVGRALMDDALQRFGELRLVARGESVGFYEALGYAPLTWDDVDKAVVDDCDHCAMRAECGPVPMGKTR